MDLDAVIRVVGALGFPIAVATFLLIRVDASLRALEERIDQALRKLEDRAHGRL